jgi:endonuclease/exonuclease/phosphatase family metal-dependent hydrolase
MKKKLRLNNSSGTGMIFFFLIPAFIALLFNCCFYNEDSGKGIRIMTYNVQEFFDDVDNGTEFIEYDPGKGKWNSWLFKERLEKIIHVITSSVPGGPDIIALQEIENMNTLGSLLDSRLRGMGYTYMVMAPEQGSVMNTGIISRIPLHCVRAYSLRQYEGRPQRKVIEVEIHYKGEVLYLFNNHWKSKRGGIIKTEEARKEAASILISRINEITAIDPFADIIVLGDLNENVDEYDKIGGIYQTALVPSSIIDRTDYYDSSIFLISEPGEFQRYSSGKPPGNPPCLFFDSWYEESVNEQGSYVFHQQWQTPDHILLSCGLFHSKGFIYKEDSFLVMNNPFLRDPLTSFPLMWDHTKGKRGYSDHLPLLITVICK